MIPFYDISLPYQTVYSATPAMKAEYAAGQANYDAEPVLFKLSGWGKGTGQSEYIASFAGAMTGAYSTKYLVNNKKKLMQ